jgi:sec-independent protein translocase protein TatB
MIELSLGKLMLLALVALIVLGPEKLPDAARTAGALMRRLRSGWDSVRAEVERELEIEELKRTAREAAAKAEAMQKEVNSTMRQTREQVETAAIETKKQVETAAVETKKEVTQIDAPKESEHGSV